MLSKQIWSLSSRGTRRDLRFLSGDLMLFTICLLFLQVGEAEKNLGHTGDVNLYAQMIDDGEGLEKIENCSHDNNEIYEKAVKILETGSTRKMLNWHLLEMPPKKASSLEVEMSLCLLWIQCQMKVGIPQVHTERRCMNVVLLN
ncbi:importin subunit alpha-like isoform X2 [Olea europaea var. sylvestris]|uniref:importin subunit alpha-like isoform X2 n=1 Tax=Olea europaea var. sylvestris TaxID=158386 RepID=UPI000C1CFF7A|nr:importin subunit alpha-like isoform X2 [Olea europaea var. sylvestris]XP_022871733.1 importin subunit alpha-like isoform X2 [Olea europaea var. sylvestris]